MAERIEATDAPPPPPPPDTESPERTPEVAPELSRAMASDGDSADGVSPGADSRGDTGQQGDAPLVSPPTDALAGAGSRDASKPTPDADRSLSGSGASDLQKADVSPELRSAMAEAGDSSAGSDNTSLTDQPNWPDPDKIRITDARATHILDGDKTGGGHRAGTGISDNTEFPATWDDAKILANVEDVARNPDIRPDKPQPWGTWLYEGTRDDVHIYAVIAQDGTVITAWPREGDPGVVKNP